MNGLWAVRVLGAGGFGVLGWRLGEVVLRLIQGRESFLPWGLVLTLVVAAVGGLIAPYLTLKPLTKFTGYVNSVPTSTLVAGIIGLLLGLVVAALISVPLYTFGGWLRWGLPIVVSLSLGIAGLWLGAQRGRAMEGAAPAAARANGATKATRNGSIIVDTSAIIDGRIADLASTGFLEGVLIVPRYVLDELRHIADSSDSLRRNRGRRGLEVLGRLRKSDRVPMQVLDVGISNGAEVDAQLVQLARSMKSPILTTDYNLNRVAELQGVQVLNINELASALKSVVLPGEELRVNIVQEGKEMGQGVGYLDDGTMIVIEGGRRYINTLHDVTVTRVLQTAAGRIIFAQPKSG